MSNENYHVDWMGIQIKLDELSVWRVELALRLGYRPEEFVNEAILKNGIQDVNFVMEIIPHLTKLYKHLETVKDCAGKRKIEEDADAIKEICDEIIRRIHLR